MTSDIEEIQSFLEENEEHDYAAEQALQNLLLTRAQLLLLEGLDVAGEADLEAARALTPVPEWTVTQIRAEAAAMRHGAVAAIQVFQDFLDNVSERQRTHLCASTHLRLARLFASEQRYDEAVASFQAALASDSKGALAQQIDEGLTRVELASVFELNQQSDMAAAQLQLVPDGHERFPQARCEQARLAREIGDLAEAQTLALSVGGDAHWEAAAKTELGKIAVAEGRLLDASIINGGLFSGISAEARMTEAKLLLHEVQLGERAVLDSWLQAIQTRGTVEMDVIREALSEFRDSPMKTVEAFQDDFNELQGYRLRPDADLDQFRADLADAIAESTIAAHGIRGQWHIARDLAADLIAFEKWEIAVKVLETAIKDRIVPPHEQARWDGLLSATRAKLPAE